ncbi:ABC transporter ATP-binding protein [Teredinibacter purpureus]|uniref:ABC transporter ATP-binding protein n=1 Tax=Teredinibacter purpureus TaxID=2731756 RepID=UPI0005F7B9CE|nr:ABC transporter ATP-binding protein [Teredinibacter purpureus]
MSEANTYNHTTSAVRADVLALDIHGLKKTYGESFEALKGIDLRVERGDFFALLGPNGAGKSTTIGVLCSLIRKTSGHVSIFGHDIDKDFSGAKQHLGLVPQEFNFNMFEKVEDIVMNQAGYYGLPRSIAAERAQRYLKRLGLWDKRQQAAKALSGGMKRRLMIARALVHEPQLLILDEPTAGVDIELRRSMWEFLQEINEAGTTIILTTHYLEEAESLCRNIAIINQGEIIENTSVKTLLKQLNKETFVLDIKNPLSQAPVVEGYNLTQTDETTLEAAVESGRSLNEMFTQLSAKGVDVISLRNKVNRLEELFVELVASSDGNKKGVRAE